MKFQSSLAKIKNMVWERTPAGHRNKLKSGVVSKIIQQISLLFVTQLKYSSQLKFTFYRNKRVGKGIKRSLAAGRKLNTNRDISRRCSLLF